VARPNCRSIAASTTPRAGPTLLMLMSGPTVAAWPQLEFFLGAPDGKYPHPAISR